VLDIAGPDRTSQNDLVARLRKITGRSAPQVPLPEVLASWGLKALGALGMDPPVAPSQLDMLVEGNVIQQGRANALTDVFGIAPTRLEDGLKRFVDEQPEQLPSEGIGAQTRKRFWVDIRGGRFTPDALFDYVCEHLGELMPSIVDMEAEPHAPARVEEGNTLTLNIPMRGHVQVRVAEASDRRVTLLTVSGHPIAGAVRFMVEPHDDAVRFEIQVYDRAATVFDHIALRTVGQWMQQGTWKGLAENVAKAAGGRSGDVQHTEDELDDHEMDVVNEWASTLAAQLSRNATSRGRD
jgi:NADH dehydrogenase